MSYRFLIVSLCFVSLCAACSLPSEPTLTPTAARKVIPTTIQASPTASFTPEPANLETAYDVWVYGTDWLGSGDLLITFQSSDPFTGEYYLELVGYRYNCRIAQDSDRLLFCVGRVAPEGSLAQVSLRFSGSDEEIFNDTVLIPYQSGSSQGEQVGGTPDLTPHPTSPPGPTP